MTLEEYYKALNLEKIYSTDRVTDSSLQALIGKLILQPEQILPQVSKLWQEIKENCSTTPSKAHLAIKQITDYCQEQNIIFQICSDNFDEKEVFAGYTKYVHYHADLFDYSKPVTFLLIGQSFDFSNNIANLLKDMKLAGGQENIYYFNVDDSPILVKQQEDLAPLAGTLIQGDAQENLPQLAGYWQIELEKEPLLGIIGEIFNAEDLG